VTLVPATRALSQKSESHRDPAFPESYTFEEIVPMGKKPEESGTYDRLPPQPTELGGSETTESFQVFAEIL
jgi:hypothetical protein